MMGGSRTLNEDGFCSLLPRQVQNMAAILYFLMRDEDVMGGAAGFCIEFERSPVEVTFALDQTLDMPQCERKRFLVRVGVSVTEAEELFGLVVHILDGVILVEDDGGVIYQ